MSSHSNAFTNSTASIVYDFSAASTCVMSSSGNSRRVRLGEPMEGLRMGKRGDRDISCAVRESFGDLRGSIFILLVKGHTKSLQRTKKRVKGEHAALNKTRLQFHASKIELYFYIIDVHLQGISLHPNLVDIFAQGNYQCTPTASYSTNHPIQIKTRSTWEAWETCSLWRSLAISFPPNHHWAQCH